MAPLAELPPGYKIWIEMYREIPHEGFRARLKSTPETDDKLSHDSFLGRWRYINDLADVDDYLINVGPTHYLRISDSVSPILIAIEFDVLARLSDIRSRLLSEKSESLWVRDLTQPEIEAQLARWDGRPSWRVTLSRLSGETQCLVRAESEQGEGESFTAPIHTPNEPALLGLLRHLDPAHLVRRDATSAENHSLLIGIEGNLQAVASQTYHDLFEHGKAVLHMRPTTILGVQHRLRLGGAVEP